MDCKYFLRVKKQVYVSATEKLGEVKPYHFSSRSSPRSLTRRKRGQEEVPVRKAVLQRRGPFARQVRGRGRGGGRRHPVRVSGRQKPFKLP